MVHHSITISYHTPINAEEYCDIERGSRDGNEIGSFTSSQECNWLELDLDTPGKFETLVTRYQERKRAS